MKRSIGALSRAVLIGISAAVLVAPAAFAATPATGAPDVEQPVKKTPQEQNAAFAVRAEKIEKDVAEAAAAVEKAKTQAEAKKAKQAAAEAKSAAEKLRDDIQVFLDGTPDMLPADRIQANQTQSRAKTAADAAGKAIAAADKKIKDLEALPDKAEIVVEPNTAGRGEVVAIVVFCPEGKVSGFASDAIDLVAESRYDEDNVSAIGGFVKKDAAAGAHTATATCGTEKLTATFTVTVTTAPVQAKKPTADDVRRKTVVKPKGKIETGGGATAQSSI